MNLIYIACPGHSGSTLLDMLLGVHDDVFSTGELVHLPNQFYRNKSNVPSKANGLLCSCGAGFYDCKFWGTIAKTITDSTKFNIYTQPLKFKISFFMNQTIPHQKLYHKITRKLILFFIKYKLKIFEYFLYSTVKKQIKTNELLIKYIHSLSQKKYIVDSSKDIYRLHYLLYSNIKIKVIILKRSIYGVAASEKKLGENPYKSSIHWIEYYSNLYKILNYHKIRPLVLDYEALVNNPLNELNKIYRFLGLNELQNIPQVFKTNNYHIVAGNGLRYKGEFSLRIDDSWKNILTEQEKNTILKIKENKFFRMLKKLILLV